MFSPKSPKQKRFKGIDLQNKERDPHKRALATKSQLIDAIRGFYVQKLGKLNRHASKGRIISVILLVLREWFSIQMHFTPTIQIYLSEFFQSSSFMDSFVWLNQVSESSSNQIVAIICLIINCGCVMYLWILGISSASLTFEPFNNLGSALIQIYEYILLIPFLFFAAQPAQNFLNYLNLAPTALIGILFSSVNYSIEIHSKDFLARYDSLSNIIIILFEILIAMSYHKFSSILHLILCGILNIFKLLSSLRCHIYQNEQINSLFLGFQILKFLFSICLLASVISENIRNVLALILMLSIPFAVKLSMVIIDTYNRFIVCSQNINLLELADHMDNIQTQDSYLRYPLTLQPANQNDFSNLFHESFLESSLTFLLSYIASNSTRNLEVFCRYLALHPSFLYAKQQNGEQTTFKLIQQLAQANAKSHGATLKQINIINEMGSDKIIWERVQRVSDIESKHLLRRFIVGLFKTTLKQIKEPSERANILCIYLMHLLTVQQNVFLAYTELVSFGQQNADKTTNWKTKQKIDWVMEILLEKSKNSQEISSNVSTSQENTAKFKEIESVQLYKILQFEIKVEALRNDFSNCVNQWRNVIGVISQSEINLEAVESAVKQFRQMKNDLTKEIEILLESNNQSEDLKILCLLVDSYLKPKVSMSGMFESHRSHQGVLLKELREFYNESSCLVMISLLPHDFGVIKRVSKNFKRVFMLQSDSMIVGHHFKRFIAPSVCPDPTRIKQNKKQMMSVKNQMSTKSNPTSLYNSQEALISGRNETNRPFLESQAEPVNGIHKKDLKLQENLETNLDVQLTEYLHKYNQLVDVQQIIVAIDSRGYALPLKVKVQTQAVESSEFGVVAWMQPLQQQNHSSIYIVINQNNKNSIETFSESFLQFLPKQFDIKKDLKQYNISTSLPVIQSLLESENELEGDLTTLLVSIGNISEINIDNSIINENILRKKELYTVNLTIKKVNNDFQAYTYVIINSKKKITRSMQKFKLITSLKMQLQEAQSKQQESQYLNDKFKQISNQVRNTLNQEGYDNTDTSPKNSSYPSLENAFDLTEKAAATKSRTKFKKLTLLFQQNLSDGTSNNSPHNGSQMSISQGVMNSPTVPLTFKGSQLKSIFAKEREAYEVPNSQENNNNSKTKLKINLISNTDMLLNSYEGEANTNEGLTTSGRVGLNFANTLDRMLEPMTVSIATTFKKINNDTISIPQLANVLALDKPIRQRSSSQPLISDRDNPMIFLSSEDPMDKEKQQYPDKILHRIQEYPVQFQFDEKQEQKHGVSQSQLKVQQDVSLNEKIFAKIDTWNTNNVKNNTNYNNSTIRENSKNSFEDIVDEEEEDEDEQDEEDEDDSDIEEDNYNKNSWKNSKQSHGNRSSINTTYENKRTMNSLQTKTSVSEIKAINIAGILLISIITILTVEGFARSYSSLILQEKNFEKINWMYLINIHVSQAFSEFNIKLQNDNGLFKQTGVILNQNFTQLIDSLLISRVTLSYELLESVSNSTGNADIQVFNIIENQYIKETLFSSYKSFTAAPTIISSMDLSASMLYTLQQQAASIYHFVNNHDTYGFLRYQSEKNYPTINMRLQTVVSQLNESYQSQLDGLRSDSLIQFVIVLLFSFFFLAAILPMSIFVHRLHNNILQLFATINLDYLKEEMKILTYFLTIKDDETNHKTKQLLLKTLRTLPDKNNLNRSRRRMSVYSAQTAFKLTNQFENINITKKGNIATAVLIPYNYKPLTLVLSVIFIIIMIYPTTNYNLISSFIDNSRHVYKFNNAFCEAYFLLINCLRARQGLAVSTLLSPLSSQLPPVYRKLFQDLVPQIPTVMGNFNSVMSDHQKLSLYHKDSIDSFIIALLQQHACNVVSSNLQYSNGDFDYYLCTSAAKGILTKGFLNGIGYFYSVFVENSYFAQLLDSAAYKVQYDLFNTRINGYNQLKFKAELTKIIDYSLNYFQIYNRKLYGYYEKFFGILFGIQITFLLLLYGIAWRSYYFKINSVSFNAKQLLDVFPKSLILKNNYIVSFLKRKK